MEGIPVGKPKPIEQRTIKYCEDSASNFRFKVERFVIFRFFLSFSFIPKVRDEINSLNKIANDPMYINWVFIFRCFKICYLFPV